MDINTLNTLYSENIELLEELYTQYLDNPTALDSEWIQFFRNLDNHPNGHYVSTQTGAEKNLSGMGITNILNSYRRQGHLAANIDPLEIAKPDRSYLEKKIGRLTPVDLETVIDSGVSTLGKTKLKNVIQWFEKTYCSSIGSEHFYLVNETERIWLQKKMEETANSEPVDKWARLQLFEKLFQAEYFEEFLAKKYVGKKRFSLEGNESFIPLLDTIIEEAGRHMMDHLVIGMAHRGRLNVLVNVMQKPAGVIFAEFAENFDINTDDYADVKYHLGYSSSKMTLSGKEIKLTLAFNPSHLEAVNPVVEGSVRARQTMNHDTERKNFLPILVHGDAAFVGQGIVAETLNLMNLEGFTTGGTFHIVVNNQIGFTTLPDESRSTLYATDLAKGFQIPIFHVNGDDVEAVYRIVKLGLDYRQKFGKDVIIDLIGYRRFGHNEMDEPAFTQPLMYDVIAKKEHVSKIYENRLLQYTDISQDEIDFIKNGVKEGLEESFNKARENDIHMQADSMHGLWSNYSKVALDSDPATDLLKSQLDKIVAAITAIPKNLTPNSKLAKLLESRYKMYLGEIPIDWGFAEAVAFGSILENGFPVRLSGQDSQRGTFSHRHAVLVDTNTNEKYIPLNHISEKQAKIEIVNASLSEYAVLGFEYGYSLSDPSTLVIWESQFGDFANNAQVIIDQFISSSEVKWKRYSGLVLLLPHGYEGQGPEHSSARIERFLQLCSMENMQVCNCTTPAQYFHLLRRQILRNYRKPLIIFTPKSLLRHPLAISSMKDLTENVFQEIIETPAQAEIVQRVIFCSGKVYYDLIQAIEKRQIKHISIIRVEQLYPFPKKEIESILEKYKKVKEFFWVQEEPKNQGQWFFIQDRLNSILPSGNRLQYNGRKSSPSPAAGHMKIHQMELNGFINEALGG